jgi:ankyrin repeat protein
VVEVLVRCGAFVDDLAGDGRTAAELAMRADHRPVVEYLVHAGAVDERGDTPLHEAALRGHREIVELLLARNASVSVKNSRGRTPLDEAVRRGHKEIVRLLTPKAAIVGQQ